MSDRIERANSKPARKPYQKPVLTRLGTLREMTLKGGGSVDSGKSKTITKTGRGGRYRERRG